MCRARSGRGRRSRRRRARRRRRRRDLLKAASVRALLSHRICHQSNAKLRRDCKVTSKPAVFLLRVACCNTAGARSQLQCCGAADGNSVSNRRRVPCVRGALCVCCAMGVVHMCVVRMRCDKSCCSLRCVRCIMHAACRRCALNDVWCMLQVVRCMLQAVCCVLHVARCTSHGTT